MADARGKVAEAQGQAQMMSSLGSIGSSLIGSFKPSGYSKYSASTLGSIADAAYV